jgi:DNA repair protein SbcC/Rad50
MRLLELKITNFRSFAHAEMNLKASGVIGIRGLNGAGKSSIFEAIFFALYGPRPGRQPTLRRDDAPNGEPTSVAVSFAHDDRLVEVVRAGNQATISIDGTQRANTKSATTAEVTRLLGLDRHQFLATFYARQKEVESFRDTHERLRNIKRLLGLTQLQKAAEIGHADLGAHELIVATLAEDTSDVKEDKALVTERSRELEALSQPIAAAEKKCELLASQRQAAWESLTQAEADAQRLQAARGELLLAQQREARDQADSQRTTQALLEAKDAQAQVKKLAATVAKMPELQATAGQFDLRKQAHDDYTAKRNSRAEAQRRLAQAQDELAGLASPDRSSEEIAADLAAAESELSQLTERLLTDQSAIADARQAAAAAAQAQQAASRAETLRGELVAMAELERDSAKTQVRLMELETRKARAERELTEETEHASEVRRDGPDAKCLRCRRAYGDQFASILHEFNATIERLAKEVKTLEKQLAKTRPRDAELSLRIAELRRKEGELASLGTPEKPLADAYEPKRRLEQLTNSAKTLETKRGTLTAHCKKIRRDLQAASGLEATRKRAVEVCSKIEAEVELLGRQLAERTPESYEPEAHQRAVQQLAETRVAEETSRRLGAVADSVELCEHRAAAEQSTLAETKTEVAQHVAAVEALAAKTQPLGEARKRVEALTNELQEAQAALSELNQTQVRLKKDLETAETALRSARREQRRLRSAQLEMRTVKVAAKGLHEYALEAQRRAIPRLETETAELLARLSGGAYNDVKLDDRAALTLLDAGEHRPLERFSGGEQDMAHLCLRLALSRTFAASRGTDPGMIILDEVFGSQDLERRGTLLEHLGRLEEEFEQIFVISHFDDVTAATDVQFEVRKTSGVSEILPV